jgi:sugar lactone lactonase YvrE
MRSDILTAAAIILTAVLISPGCPAADVTTVDLIAPMRVNAAGPFLLRVDEARNRLVAANTLSSSITIIDCSDESVRNIPIGGRGLQHLKSESMALDPESGRICLIGNRSVHLIDPATGEVTDIATEHQYESAAICSGTGNLFVTGRETGKLGFLESSSGSFNRLEWLERSEPLVNMNATPPPPIRKVLYDGVLDRVIAVDGYTSTIYTFDPETGGRILQRKLAVGERARWHLAGYDCQRHNLHLVLEGSDRKVTEAVLVDIDGGDDIITPLPGLTEGVGICFNRSRNELYVGYDNHPTVHIVDYGRGAEISEIKIPAYGNDGAAVDTENGILYVASWAHGEVDVVDLNDRKLVRRIKNLGIIPHMFSFVFNPRTNLLYFPRGATAVNGTFGSAITVLDPATEKSWKIRTGWAPVELIEIGDGESFLVFSSEDIAAEVRPDGRLETHTLPVDYPVTAGYSPSGKIYLSYGPHQSYWPTVYIWGAKNGVLTIDPEKMKFYDRRIPRQALDMAVDRDGVLHLAQNNWGRECQFITRLFDEVRLFDPGRRLVLPDTVQRETTQRVLEYDSAADLLYLLKAGENDSEKSTVYIINPDSGSAAEMVKTGINSTALAFDPDYLCTADFGSGTVTVIRKSDLRTIEVPAGESPVRIRICGGTVYLIDHTGNRLMRAGRDRLDRVFDGRLAPEDLFETFDIPFAGLPGNLSCSSGAPVITSHSSSRLAVLRFDPEEEDFEELLDYDYPFGEVSLASANSSFYMKGQFGDAVFTINRIETGAGGRIWITDFLAGKLFVIGN